MHQKNCKLTPRVPQPLHHLQTMPNKVLLLLIVTFSLVFSAYNPKIEYQYRDYGYHHGHRPKKFRQSRKNSNVFFLPFFKRSGIRKRAVYGKSIGFYGNPLIKYECDTPESPICLNGGFCLDMGRLTHGYYNFQTCECAVDYFGPNCEYSSDFLMERGG